MGMGSTRSLFNSPAANLLPVLLLSLSMSCSPSGSGTNDQAPNIVFLFADDYTYDAIRALGNEVVVTPNLDQLVATGTTFTRAYNMGGWNGAICIASRSMIISGRTIWNAHDLVPRWKQGDTLETSRAWGNLMESQGYQTRMSGKWHVALPAEQAFQVTRNVRPGMPPDAWVKEKGMTSRVLHAYQNKEDLTTVLPVGYHRPMGDRDPWHAADTTFGGFWSGGQHWSEVLAGDAIQFIEEAGNSGQPFFLYLAFNAPHDPRQAPQPYLDMYPVEDMPLPDSWLEEYPDKDGMGCDPSLRDEALAPFPRTAHAIRQHLREYYAIISHLDAQIGAIINALEQSGEIDNTYFVFTADHGLSVGKHGLLGKQNMYEHSVRAPLIIKGPGIPANKRITAPVYIQDVLPTTLELAGAGVPPHIEFNSLLPLINDKAGSSYDDGIYIAYIDLQRAIIQDNYKLILYPEMAKFKLFDLEDDPMELNNLADQESSQPRIRSLFEALLNLQKKYNDPLDLRPYYPQLDPKTAN